MSILDKSGIREKATKITEVLQKHQVEFMIIGTAAVVLQGVPVTTQDVDVYPENSKANREKLVEAVVELGFKLENYQRIGILYNDNIIKLTDPFEMDLMFTPGDFVTYKDADKYKKVVFGIPVMSVSGVVRTKKAANRPKDRVMVVQLEPYI